MTDVHILLITLASLVALSGLVAVCDRVRR